MNYQFHPLALEEFQETALHYEGCHPGLGDRFVNNIESAINHIAENPLASPELEAPVRSKLVRVFPYSILYVPGEDLFTIIAVMHLHRKPGYWRDRVESNT